MDKHENHQTDLMIKVLKEYKLEIFKDLSVDLFDCASEILEISILGKLVKAGQFVSKFKERIFTIKIMQFLSELEDIPVKKRIQKIDEINESEKLQYSIGLVILEQLQRIDIQYKPQVLGKLFASYIEERITLEEYLRLVHIVSNSFYLDLKSIKEYSQNGLYKNKNYNGLVDSELMQIDYTEVYNAERNSNNEENYPKLTVLGNLLLEHGL